MKSLGKKGFTLIELLAVITIMGILMLIAIPAVSRTIENSRRDTFADNVKTYINAVRNAVLADELKCGDSNTTISAMPDGKYYFLIDTAATTGANDLMEKNAKSSWGNADLKGYVMWRKELGKTTYYAFISDTANHGMYKEVAEKDIERGSISTKISSENCGTPSSHSGCSAATSDSRPSGTSVTECTVK